MGVVLQRMGGCPVWVCMFGEIGLLIFIEIIASCFLLSQGNEAENKLKMKKKRKKSLGYYVVIFGTFL